MELLRLPTYSSCFCQFIWGTMIAPDECLLRSSDSLLGASPFLEDSQPFPPLVPALLVDAFLAFFGQLEAAYVNDQTSRKCTARGAIAKSASDSSTSPNKKAEFSSIALESCFKVSKSSDFPPPKESD